ncbi:uncharacterized protein LOC117176875 [Belonocnema kinseyi]|uniref:uncharacterized protein LOC117176875 n=1 Tax=Belonocnema kinseyi TaxID=2817044 RepID=UPI00143D2A75|nr:uncharacterized protein LOC117176875 [Belonocnema kinseyi]
MENWLSNHHLQLANKKTAGHSIEAIDALKYLGIDIDAKLNFEIQITKTDTKVVKMVVMLSRLMLNVRGPRSSKRRILMSVANFILLYGAEVRADALKVKCRRNRLLKVQYKGAFRVSCAYRLAKKSVRQKQKELIEISILWKEMRLLKNGTAMERGNERQMDCQVNRRSATVDQ